MDIVFSRQFVAVGGDAVFAQQMSTSAGVDGAMQVTERADGAFVASGSDLFQATGFVAWPFSAQITEADDTLSSTGAVSGVAALSQAEQNDTLQSQVTTTTFASLTSIDANDTLSATSTTQSSVNGVLAATEAPDTAQIVGNVPFVAARLAIGEADDGISATVALFVAAELQATDANDTVASNNTVTSFAALQGTDQDDTLLAVTSADEVIDADLSSTDANDTASAEMAVYVVAAVSGAEQSDAVASDAALTVTASLLEVSVDDVLASTGSWLDVDDAQLDQAEQDDGLVALLTTAFRVQRRGGFVPRDANTSRSKWLSD